MQPIMSFPERCTAAPAMCGEASNGNTALPECLCSLAEVSISADRNGQDLDSVNTLVERFSQCWNDENKNFENLPVDLEKLRKRILAYTMQFHSPLNLDNAYGFIEKRDFVHPTRIGVQADIHGDLKGVLELLKEFQKEGLLDENYKCLSDVQIVFLGDYVDRGYHSTQVLEVLLAFHMENPDKVVLLRGNHEAYNMNCKFSSTDMYEFGGGRDTSFAQFVYDYMNEALLKNLYSAMPLSLYVGQTDEHGHRQYVQFSHGLFELWVDPSTMLDDQREKVQMVVLKERKLSERVHAIKFEATANYMERLSYAADKIMRKRLKLEFAAREITALCNEEGPRNCSDSTYTWGDIQNDQSNSYVERPNDRRGWILSPRSILCYLRLSGNQNPVKIIIRGHQHQHRYFMVNGKTVAVTLPVSIDNEYFKKFCWQPSEAYILITAPKVKNWRKTVLRREYGSSQTTAINSYFIRDCIE